MSVTHIRGDSGRPLCGARPNPRTGWAFAKRPEVTNCRSCWGRFKPPKVQALTDAELLELDRGWRQGWAQEFPLEPYPGLVEARRRIRAKLAPWAATPAEQRHPPR